MKVKLKKLQIKLNPVSVKLKKEGEPVKPYKKGPMKFVGKTSKKG